MQSKTTLSIVLPCKNEAKSLETITNRIIIIANDLDVNLELLIIDDGSSDETWEIIKSLKNRHKCIRGLKFYKNFGKEAAIYAGLSHATGDALILMDADLEHPTDLIKDMYKLWSEKNLSTVLCVKKNTNRNSLLKDFGAYITYKLLRILSHIDLKNSSDFMLLDKKIYKQLSSLKEYNTFFRGQVAWYFGKEKEILYFTPETQKQRKSNWNILKLLELSLDAIISFTIIPLRVLSFIGIVFILCSLLLIAQTLIMFFLGKSLEGFTTVITLILLMGGFIILGIGIIGEYVGKIYEEVKERPKYLIKEEI
ncbi:MAG: glycosyltransferase family 2 protein [Bdellovibrionota bacterium]